MDLLGFLSSLFLLGRILLPLGLLFIFILLLTTKNSNRPPLGRLRVRVQKGINLAVCDTFSGSSDPYVVLTMGELTMKTRVVKNNCNPEWNDELTLPIFDVNAPIILEVYDRDTFTRDDKMGDAEIDIKPFTESLEMQSRSFSNGEVVKRVRPSWENCLSVESCCVWNNGKIVQDMRLRLRNVNRGEVVLQIEMD